MAAIEKKDLLTRFKALIQEIYPPPSGQKPRFKQGLYSTKGPDGSEVHFGLQTMAKGFPPGTFDAYTSFAIDRGTIFEIMADLGLEKNHDIPGDGLARGILHNFVDRVPFHLFNDRTDLDAELRRIRQEIVELYLPVIVGLTKDFRAGLDLLVATYSKELIVWSVRNPFTTATILSHLAGKPQAALDLARSMAGAKAYYDLGPDYQERILTPVAKWFEKHPR